THAERFEHVTAPRNAAIADDLDAIPDRIDDLGELVERRPPAIELTPAVVGDHDRARADVDGPARVLDRHHALETDRAAPFAANALGCAPVERLIEHGAEVIGNR